MAPIEIAYGDDQNASAIAMVVADMDDDGRPDLVFADQTGPVVRILLNRSEGTE